MYVKTLVKICYLVSFPPYLMNNQTTNIQCLPTYQLSTNKPYCFHTWLYGLCYKQGGRGHWTVNYKCTQNLNHLWDFDFDWQTSSVQTFQPKVFIFK